jgi:hypothetical protein
MSSKVLATRASSRSNLPILQPRGAHQPLVGAPPPLAGVAPLHRGRGLHITLLLRRSCGQRPHIMECYGDRRTSTPPKDWPSYERRPSCVE